MGNAANFLENWVPNLHSRWVFLGDGKKISRTRWEHKERKKGGKEELTSGFRPIRESRSGARKEKGGGGDLGNVMEERGENYGGARK